MYTYIRGCPRGVMVKAMDCGIVVSMFELHVLSLSGNYPWERYEPPYPPSYALNCTTTVLLGQWLCHWMTYKGWYAIKQRNQTVYIYKSQPSVHILFRRWMMLCRSLNTVLYFSEVYCLSSPPVSLVISSFKITQFLISYHAVIFSYLLS